MPRWSRSLLLITPACAGNAPSGRAGLTGDETPKDACGYRSLRHFRLVPRGVVLFGVKLRKTVAPCQLPLPCSEKVSFTPEFLTHGLVAAVLHRERRPVAYTSVSHHRCLGQLSGTALAFERSAIGSGAPAQERLLPVERASRQRPWWRGTTVRAGPKKCHLLPNI